MSRQTILFSFTSCIALCLAAQPAAAAEGHGEVVIDGDRYEFEAETCVAQSQEQVMISGPGTGSDGTPIYVDFTPSWLIVRLGTDDPQSPADTEYISDGESAGAGDGERHPGLVVEDGRAEAELAFVEGLNARDRVGPGTIEASCD